MLKQFFVNHFPVLGKFKRFGKAWYHSIQPIKRSYSQHGEDVVIADFLSHYDLRGSVYVDVGANHPSDISNSYLLYRKGLSGIVVEPNPELAALFSKFRPKDIALAIGCSNENAILPFHVSKTPVLSSFAESRDANVYKTKYLPVIRLDDAIRHLNFAFVNMLSIDVEGLNYEVLEGARETVAKSLLICLEYETEEDREKFSRFLGDDFVLYREMGCNLIFINKKLSQKLTGAPAAAKDIAAKKDIAA